MTVRHHQRCQLRHHVDVGKVYSCSCPTGWPKRPEERLSAPDVRSVLEEVRDAIASLPAEALGIGGKGGGTRWAIQENLLARMDAALFAPPPPAAPEVREALERLVDAINNALFDNAEYEVEMEDLQARKDLEVAFAAARAALSASPWRRVEEVLPPGGSKVIALWWTSYGKPRRVMAQHYGERELELNLEQEPWEGCEWDEDEEHLWCPPGWYTAGDCLACEGAQWTLEEVVTHWMPLPAPPQEQGDDSDE